jgi:hypothetical protein
MERRYPFGAHVTLITQIKIEKISENQRNHWRGYVGLLLRHCSGQALAVAFAQAASVFPASDRRIFSIIRGEQAVAPP